MYKVPLFNPLMFPDKIKFLDAFFSEHETKIRIENRAIIDLRISKIFGNNTKKNPQSDEQIEDLKMSYFELSF